MLNPFPIQYLALLAYFALRLIVGTLLIAMGIRHIKHKTPLAWAFPFSTPLSFAFACAEIMFGAMFILGFYTQYASLGTMALSIILLVTHRKTPSKEIPQRIFCVLLFAVSLSLFITGAGAFAFDLPI